jgi:hypothetical protein
MTDTEAGLIMAAIYASGIFLVGFAIALGVAFSPLAAPVTEPPKQNPAWIGLEVHRP